MLNQRSQLASYVCKRRTFSALAARIETQFHILRLLPLAPEGERGHTSTRCSPYLAGGAGSPRLLPAREAEMCPPARCYESSQRLSRTRERRLVHQHTIQGAHHHLSLRAASTLHVLHPTDKFDAPSCRKHTKPENTRVQPPQGSLPALTSIEIRPLVVCALGLGSKKNFPPTTAASLPLRLSPRYESHSHTTQTSFVPFSMESLDSSLASSLGNFTFGIEIETLLRPQERSAVTAQLAKHGYEASKSLDPGRPRRENRAAIRNVLAEWLSVSGLASVAIHDTEEDQNYELWSIAWDTSINEETDHGWSGYCKSIFLFSSELAELYCTFRMILSPLTDIALQLE
jgi:hypothetical protein